MSATYRVLPNLPATLALGCDSAVTADYQMLEVPLGQSLLRGRAAVADDCRLRNASLRLGAVVDLVLRNRARGLRQTEGRELDPLAEVPGDVWMADAEGEAPRPHLL